MPGKAIPYSMLKLQSKSYVSNIRIHGRQRQCIP